MPTQLIRYALDTTGVNPDNFVQDEAVVLENRRIRAIAPKEGAFFGASMVIRENSTGRTLTQGIHYSPGEYFRTASEMAGKRIYGIVLVNDPSVSSNLTISYQVIGGEFTSQSDSIKHLLEQHRHDGTEYSYYDVVGKPDAFDPTPHYHTLDDGMGFQYMTQALERIRNAILWADSPAIQDIYTYIETLLADLDEKLKHKVDSILAPLLYEFRRTINKATIGLDKVENLRVATPEEGTKAGLLETKIQDFLERKYVALDTIVAFKDSLYNSLVSKETTNLGRTAATFLIPKKERLFALPNGAVVTFLSKREALATVNGFEQSCYPPGISDDDRVTIVKVINNRNNRGGIFLCYLMNGTKAFIGTHTSGNITEDISWRRFLFTEDLKVFTDLLAAHIANTNNPHKVRKDQVGLSEVENLPVVTREEILCLKSVRKYMTFDAFLLFMKAFMIGKNGSAADPGDESGEPLENCQIIYCPCSPCGCGPSSSTPPPSYPPAGQELSWSCRGFDKWGVYHNGSGGTYDQIIATNSPECGWTPPATPPPAGQELGWFCEGKTKMGKYSDGKGGVYNNPIQENSPDCGSTPPGSPPPSVPPSGEPSIALVFLASSVRVGTPNAVGVTVTSRGLTAGKRYNTSYKVKFENQAQYMSGGIAGGEFTASSSERVTNESFLNEGNAYTGRLAVIAVLTDIATNRQYESAPAYVNLIVDKAIEFAVNGIKTGGDIAAGSSVTLTAAFKDWPINIPINYQVFIYDAGGALLQVQMNQLGVGNTSAVLTPVDAAFRGQQKYKIRGRWAVPIEAGGGTRELDSNIVTINWTGPNTTCPPNGLEVARECNGPNLVATYHNGSCGIYTQVVEYNASHCVGSPPVPTPTPPPSPTPTPPPPPPAGETIQRAIRYTISMTGAGSSYQGEIQAVWSTANSAQTVTISGVQGAISQLTASGQASVGGGVVRSFQQSYFAGAQPWDQEPMVFYFVPKAAFQAADFELYFEGTYYGSQP